jgi:excisionase family DNA binding protein
VETPINDTVESYRKAELRLRQVLLGDGVDTPGLVKGEDLRLRVARDLRRMRDAFNSAALADERTHLQQAEERLAGLEAELRMLVSGGSGTREPTRSGTETAELMTPAEAARTLKVSASSIYRAVKKGEIRAVRLTDSKRGALRIPASEVEAKLTGELVG